MPPAEASEPIPAATVVLLRDGPSGLETLMLRRNGRGPFGGMWVFPGGRVEPADLDPDHPDDELASARRAAVREATEEAGIVVDPGSLVPYAHWTPPPFQPKRYATWFFVAPGPEAEIQVDGVEIHEHAWLAPAEVLRRRDAGQLELAVPTWVSLWYLREHGRVEDALRERAALTPERFRTRPVRLEETTVMVWHGDAGYPSGDLATPGPRHRLSLLTGGWRYERSAGDD